MLTSLVQIIQAVYQDRHYHQPSLNYWYCLRKRKPNVSYIVWPDVFPICFFELTQRAIERLNVDIEDYVDMGNCINIWVIE